MLISRLQKKRTKWHWGIQVSSVCGARKKWQTYSQVSRQTGDPAGLLVGSIATKRGAVLLNLLLQAGQDAVFQKVGADGDVALQAEEFFGGFDRHLVGGVLGALDGDTRLSGHVLVYKRRLSRICLDLELLVDLVDDLRVGLFRVLLGKPAVLALLRKLRKRPSQSIKEHKRRDALCCGAHLAVQLLQRARQVSTRRRRTTAHSGKAGKQGPGSATEAAKAAAVALVLLELLLQLGNVSQGLEGRVQVAGVSEVLQAGGGGAVDLGELGVRHVLDELGLLFGGLDGFARGGAHHHDLLAGLEVELGHVGVVLELAALDQDLLALGFDVGEREEHHLEDLSGHCSVNRHVIFLAGMLDDDWGDGNSG